MGLHCLYDHVCLGVVSKGVCGYTFTSFHVVSSVAPLKHPIHEYISMYMSLYVYDLIKSDYAGACACHFTGQTFDTQRTGGNDRSGQTNNTPLGPTNRSPLTYIRKRKVAHILSSQMQYCKLFCFTYVLSLCTLIDNGRCCQQTRYWYIAS